MVKYVPAHTYAFLVWGRGKGFRVGLAQGEGTRYTIILDPGLGHTPPRGGGARGAVGLDPKRRGAPY
jgi:hypothetical protein